MKTVRYPSWGQFLKTRRSQRYRSARTFCSQAALAISYPQYSRYEAGEQLPAIDQAIEIITRLGVPLLEGILEWNLAQMPTDESRQAIEGVLEQMRRGGASAGVVTSVARASLGPASSLDETIVFNRSHLRLFSSDPKYRDIFSFINSFAPRQITIQEIATVMQIPNDQALRMVTELSDLGVVDFEGGVCVATKKNFYFPDDRDFFELRNLNLIHNAKSILSKLTYSDIAERRAFRGLMTRELTHDQMTQVHEKMDALIRQVTAFPETDRPEHVYSICLLMGERFTRPEARKVTGVTSERFLESPVGTA